MTLHAQWLEAMRADWDLRRPRTLFTERRESSRPDDTHLTPSQHLGVLPQEQYMETTGNKVVLNLTGSDNMKHVEPDDFVIHLRSFQGGIEHSTYRGKVSNAYTVLCPGADVEPRFFRWVLKAPGFIQELSTTAEQLRDGQSIRFDQFARVGLPLPPLEEQRRIADFLDDQGARIDMTSGLRRSQIALVNEQIEVMFQRELQEVVDLDVLSKPRRLAQLLSRNQGGVWGEEPSGVADTVVLRSTEISRQGQWHSLQEAALRSLSEGEARATRLAVGDIVLTKASGSPDHIGKCAIVDAEVAGMNASFGNFMQRLTARGEIVDPEYLHLFLMSRLAREQFQLLSTSSTGLMNLSAGLLSDVRVPTPSLGRQRELVVRVRDRQAAVSALAWALSSGVERLNEYKRSLITAAVTGELDVTTARPRVPA